MQYIQSSFGARAEEGLPLTDKEARVKREAEFRQRQEDPQAYRSSLMKDPLPPILLPDYLNGARLNAAALKCWPSAETLDGMSEGEREAFKADITALLAIIQGHTDRQNVPSSRLLLQSTRLAEQLRAEGNNISALMLEVSQIWGICQVLLVGF